MTQFLKVVSPKDAVAIVSDHLSRVTSEFVSTESSLKRILYRDIVAEIQLPEFVRSSMDGFSVKASNTFGATRISRSCR